MKVPFIGLFDPRPAPVLPTQALQDRNRGELPLKRSRYWPDRANLAETPGGIFATLEPSAMRKSPGHDIPPWAELAATKPTVPRVGNRFAARRETPKAASGATAATPLNPVAGPLSVSNAPTMTINNASLARLLREAIGRSQIDVHYQPQYDMQSGRGYGMEALARWTLSTGVIVAPSVFIPIAERTGMIHDLGSLVLRSACMSTVALERQVNHAVTLAVNVSPLQIDERFHAVVARALKDSGLSPTHLELEITENALHAKPELTMDCFRELKRLGVRIALDDFGSGYSSLGRLSRLPVDSLKLDRSLVKGINRDPKSTCVTRLIIALGAELAIDVIAEGVETEVQFQSLKDLNCPKIQGFLCGRPTPVEQTRVTLKRKWGDRSAPALKLPRRTAFAGESHVC